MRLTRLMIVCSAVLVGGCAFDPAGDGPLRQRDGSVTIVDAAAVAVDVAQVAVDAEVAPIDAATQPIDAAMVAIDSTVFMDVGVQGSGESCLSPYDLGVVPAGQMRVIGRTTAGASDDHTPACNTEQHPDHVFVMQSDVDARMVVTLNPSGWNGAIDITSGPVCLTPFPVVCVQGTGMQTAAIDVSARVPYWIWIDGASNGGNTQSGSYTLTIATAPVP